MNAVAGATKQQKWRCTRSRAGAPAPHELVFGGPHRVPGATFAGILYSSKPRKINVSVLGLLRAMSLALLSSRR